MSANTNIAAITEEMIKTAIKNDDLDAALRPMMQAAKIKSGDIAGICFSELSDDPEDEDSWANLPHDRRGQMIRNWIKTEKSYEDDEGEEGKD